MVNTDTLWIPWKKKKKKKRSEASNFPSACHSDIKHARADRTVPEGNMSELFIFVFMRQTRRGKTLVNSKCNSQISDPSSQMISLPGPFFISPNC